MQNSGSKMQAVRVMLTEEHLRKMVNDHLLKTADIGDQAKVAHAVQKVLDEALGLPETSWHDWDEWGEGLE